MRLVLVWFAIYFAQFLDNFWLQNLWVNFRAPRDLRRKISPCDPNDFTTLSTFTFDFLSLLSFWLNLDRFFKMICLCIAYFFRSACSLSFKSTKKEELREILKSQKIAEQNRANWEIWNLYFFSSFFFINIMWAADDFDGSLMAWQFWRLPLQFHKILHLISNIYLVKS